MPAFFLTNTPSRGDKRARVALVAGAVLTFSLLLLVEFHVSSTSLVGSLGLSLSYLSGMTMIALPCTLPMLLIIVPMAMSRPFGEGLPMALLFGLGVSMTLSAYGAGLAVSGHYLGIDRPTQVMWLTGGVAAYLFGLGQLGLLRLRLPVYSGPLPSLPAGWGGPLQALVMGLLLGNAGIGCPCPHWYLVLVAVAASGDPGYGAYMGLAQGLGRATPVVALTVLAMLGVNGTGFLLRKRARIERASGAALVMLGAFIVAFMAVGHPWWEATPVHYGWNLALRALGGSNISEVDPGGGPFPPGTWWVPGLFLALLGVAALLALRRLKAWARGPAAEAQVSP